MRGRNNYSAASIFLPAAGYGTAIYRADSYGEYWSHVPDESDSGFAGYLHFYSGAHTTYGGYRYNGQSIRPVWQSAQIDLSTLTADYTAQDGDVLTGETAYNVAIPGGAMVTINGVPVAGGGTALPAPAFAEGCEAATMTFAKGLGNTWTLTAFAELANDAVGADIADGAIKVYRGDTADGVTNAVVPTITGKKSAVKVEMTVDAPADASQQFFKVKFGE